MQAEQDRQLLQNRINRLIVEEEKAAKRIAETRRRAKEIWELKRRNEASQATRQDAGAWMSAEQELQKELMRAARSLPGESDFVPQTAVVLQELTKMLACIGLCFREGGCPGRNFLVAIYVPGVQKCLLHSI